MNEKHIIKDTHINTVAIIGHSTTGVPAAGFGVGIDTSILFQADSSISALRDIGRISFAWDIATHADRRSVVVIEAVRDGRLVEVARINANGEIVSVKEK